MEGFFEYDLPFQVWYTLREAAELKGVNYKTLLNKKFLQPNGGVPDGEVGGRRVFKRDAVLRWVEKQDSELTAKRIE